MAMLTCEEMRDLWNSNDGDQWRRFESVEYSNMIRNTDLEHEIESLDKNVLFSNSYTDFFSFLFDRYFPWKYTQPNRLTTTRNRLSEMTDFEKQVLFESFRGLDKCLSGIDPTVDYIKGSFMIATMVKGLGIAGASGLLSVMYPHLFGTVDQFVVHSLDTMGLNTRVSHPEGLTIEDAVSLERIMIKKAAILNEISGTSYWTPRKIDKVLWCIRVLEQ